MTRKKKLHQALQKQELITKILQLSQQKIEQKKVDYEKKQEMLS